LWSSFFKSFSTHSDNKSNNQNENISRNIIIENDHKRVNERENKSSNVTNRIELIRPELLRMPELEVGKASLLQWSINDNEIPCKVESGQIICEIDSELAVIDYKAQKPGILIKKLVNQGDKLIDKQAIALFLPTDDDKFQELTPEKQKLQIEHSKHWQVADDQNTVFVPKHLSDSFTETVAKL